jgi:hypothetical protein
MENSMKHGGFKWQVSVPAPQGCHIGFEGATVGVDNAVIQYHSFGNYEVEFEGRVHSTVALLRQCMPDSDDYGYIYTVQWQDYGQRLFSYQGLNMPYLNAPSPEYPTGLGPYFTSQCVYCGSKADTRDEILANNSNASTIWTSKGARGEGQHIFNLLFRSRDLYQVVDQRDMTYPFTFLWLCSTDGGLTFSPTRGCRYNNSTTRVHEVAGSIPAEWDNLEGFDTDTRVGRITADGYTDHLGKLNLSCTMPGTDCFPIHLVAAYVGNYGSELTAGKVSNPTPSDTPERDIYFCGNQVCSEGDPGATSSGWIGQEN